MPALLPDQRTRLVKLLGMLGSSHDGERANAARAADTLVRGAGCTWSDVVGGVPVESQPRWFEPRSHDERIAAIHFWQPPLSEWEEGFLASVSMRDEDDISPKQQAIIDRLVARARAFAMQGMRR